MLLAEARCAAVRALVQSLREICCCEALRLGTTLKKPWFDVKACRDSFGECCFWRQAGERDSHEKGLKGDAVCAYTRRTVPIYI